MPEYTVSTKEQHAAFTVDGKSYADAATRAARQLNKRQRSDVVAHRTTGDTNLSGWFQGYYHDKKLNGLNSIGQPFHLMPV